MEKRRKELKYVTKVLCKTFFFKLLKTKYILAFSFIWG